MKQTLEKQTLIEQILEKQISDEVFCDYVYLNYSFSPDYKRESLNIDAQANQPINITNIAALFKTGLHFERKLPTLTEHLF